jgi:hypothetical protein
MDVGIYKEQVGVVNVILAGNTGIIIPTLL